MFEIETADLPAQAGLWFLIGVNCVFVFQVVHLRKLTDPMLFRNP